MPQAPKRELHNKTFDDSVVIVLPLKRYPACQIRSAGRCPHGAGIREVTDILFVHFIIFFVDPKLPITIGIQRFHSGLRHTFGRERIEGDSFLTRHIHRAEVVLHVIVAGRL